MQELSRKRRLQIEIIESRTNTTGWFPVSDKKNMKVIDSIVAAGWGRLVSPSKSFIIVRRVVGTTINSRQLPRKASSPIVAGNGDNLPARSRAETEHDRLIDSIKMDFE